MTDQLLKKLVRFKTITRNQNENAKAFQWIKDQIKDLPVFIKDFESEGFPSLLITTRKTKTPKIWLVAHMDVVHASEKMFKPEIKGGKLYGRGVFDMKFAIAAYLNLLLDLNQDLKNYDFGIMLVSDEEIGGFNGAKKLVEKGYRSEVILLPDGGENWIFVEAAKGVFSVMVTSKGQSAHGARIWLGKNAINNLMDFLTLLRKEFEVEPCNDKLHFHTTLNVGKISGGKATNQVPDYAQASLDIRFVPSTNFDELEKRISLIKKNFPDINFEVKTKGISYEIDKNNKYLKRFIEILNSKKIKTSFLKSHGSSDARFFIEKGVPAILIRPVGGNLHSEKEWIDIKSLELFYDVLKEFIEKTARKIN